MPYIDLPYLSEQWLIQERIKTTSNRKDFIGDRPYRHFDGRISLEALESNQSKVIHTLRSAEKVSAHSFLPFIRRDKSVRKYQKGQKISKKTRPIMYASHRDACIYAFYAYILRNAYEDSIRNTPLKDSVIAYRHIKRSENTERGKSNIDFAKDIFELCKQFDRCAVLCLDIEKYFDSMDHSLIKQRWKEVLGTEILPTDHYAVYKNLTKYRYVFHDDALERLGYCIRIGGKLKRKRGKTQTGALCTPETYRKKIDCKIDGLIHYHRTSKGIPQGSPISDAIANIYLRNFDHDLNAYLSRLPFGKQRRYSDDILVICPQENLKQVYDYITSRMKEEKVAIKPSKTEALIIDNVNKIITDVTHSITGLKEHELSNRQTLQYLGFEIDTKDMHVRSGTVAGHYRRAKRRSKKLIMGSVGKKKNNKKRDNRTHKNRSYWQYFISATKRIKSTRIHKQMRKMTKRANGFSKRNDR